MFEQQPQERADALAKAIDFAGKYVRTFDHELLNHLYRTIVEHTLPATATLQEHAELNGQRKLIVGIIRQHQLANTGSPETPWVSSITSPQAQTEPMPAQQRATKGSRRRKT